MTSTAYEKPSSPWYLLLLATAYVLLGAWGIYQTISSGLQQLHYELAVLLLLGIGLFFRNKWARFFALAWLVPNYLFAASILFSLLFFPYAVSFHFDITYNGIGPNLDHISFAPYIYVGLYLLLTLAQQLILTRERVRQSILPLSFVERLSDRLEGSPTSRKNRIAWLSSLAVIAIISAFLTFRIVGQFVSLLAMDSQILNARLTAAAIKLLNQDEKEKAHGFLCATLADNVQAIEALRAGGNRGVFPTWALTEVLAQDAKKREIGQMKIQAAIDLCKNKAGAQ